MNETAVQYRTTQPWRLRLYAASSGVGNGFGLLMMYVSYIAAGGYGILVATVGVILTFTRIFDGITDPIVALISDRTNTKYGKIRILQWAGWAVMALSCATLFIFGVGRGIVFFIIIYLVYILGYTMYNVATNIGNMTITNDPKQRPLLARWSTIFTMLVMMGGSSVIMAAFLPMFGGEYTNSMLGFTCIFIIVLTAVLNLIASIAITPADKPENFTVGMGHEKPISLRDCWHLIKSNRALQMYTVAAASDKLALQIAGNTAFNTLLFGVLIGNMGLSTIMSALTMPISLVGAILSTRMAARQGSKHALIYWTWFAIIFAGVGVLFYAFFDLSKVFHSIVITVLFFGLTILRNVGQNGASACGMAMMGDISDYETSMSGKVMPGTVAACYSFIDKIISSLATTIAGFALAAIGYVSVMPQPTDAATPQIRWLVIIMTLCVPMIGWLCTIVAMKFYPLTKEKMVEVQAKVNELRESAAEEAPAAE